MKTNTSYRSYSNSKLSNILKLSGKDTDHHARQTGLRACPSDNSIVESYHCAGKPQVAVLWGLRGAPGQYDMAGMIKDRDPRKAIPLTRGDLLSNYTNVSGFSTISSSRSRVVPRGQTFVSICILPEPPLRFDLALSNVPVGGSVTESAAGYRRD